MGSVCTVCECNVCQWFVGAAGSKTSDVVICVSRPARRPTSYVSGSFLHLSTK